MHPTAFTLRPVVRTVTLLVAALASAAGLRGDEPAARRVEEKFLSGKVPIQTMRFEPPGQERRPAVVLLHGADGWGQMAGYRYAADGLTRAGYVAILVRYYDRTGTPDRVPDTDQKEFVQWIRGDLAGPPGNRARRHFTEWTETVRDAVAHARTLPNVDPERVAVVGFSLGGYLALAAAPTCDPPIKAVVEMFGGLPEEPRKALGKLPPTLILHGAEDTVVPVIEAYKAAGFALAQKQQVEIDVRPGVGHVFADPKTGLPVGDELKRGRDRMTESLTKRFGATAADRR